MTDLEITRLCAEAMGLTKSPSGYGLVGYMDIHPYDPLKNDAQAMALVKKYRLLIRPWDCCGLDKASWSIVPDHGETTVNPDLNRAICECVAKMQATK